MTERTARRAADNNVADVINTIEAYSCGPIRALAQDPPQNALDARRNKGEIVHVIYRLFERSVSDGEKMNILTITDSGTTGLDGLTLTSSDLEKREHRLGRLEIEQDENWAAFEANRYTKTDQEKLGSRGQGKYAYLYHSKHPISQGGADQMIILYDTLLMDGEYRLGVRYHNPATKVIEPPFLDEEARETISTIYEDEHFNIPLQLEPLTQAGTRIIIPFLSDEAVEAIQNGELLHWLQAEWWRAIQKGDMKITLINDLKNTSEDVSVPAWWEGEPWRRGSSNYFVKENIDLPSRNREDRESWRIKRSVLYAGDPIVDIEDLPAQFNGIQLLRGSQWIVTLDPKEYLDLIPKEHRSGFCGFVEFEQRLEVELREIEKPAHDGFDGRKPLYKEIKNVLKGIVEEFSREQGWYEETAKYDPKQDELITEITAKLGIWKPTSPPPPESESDQWNCLVKVNQRRFDCGDSMSISATCHRRPALHGEMVVFQPSLITPQGTRIALNDSRSQKLNGRNELKSSAGATFNDLPIHASRFKEPGRYKAVVDCFVNDDLVVTGKCPFYVNEEPPVPPQRVLLSVTAGNKHGGAREIPMDGELFWKVNVRNNTVSTIHGKLAVTIEDTPEILQVERIELRGVSSGHRAESAIFLGTRKVEELNSLQGRNVVLASVEDDYGNLLASGSFVIFIGEGDENAREPELPFVLEQRESPMSPRWELEEPREGGEYKLKYYGNNRIFRILRDSSGKRSDRHPSDNYMEEIVCEAIVEWAHCEHMRGDEGRMNDLVAGIKNLNIEAGENFEGLVEKFVADNVEPQEYARIHRQLASIVIDTL